MKSSKSQPASGPVAEDDFYRKTLSWLLDQRVLTREMRLLVVCGGGADKDVLHNLGFTNVTISNLDTRLKGDEFAPYEWSHQDAENLTYRDGEFDFAIAHNGLHHCYSPHHALLEMHRVCRVGVLVFEPRDTLITRMGVSVNLGQELTKNGCNCVMVLGGNVVCQQAVIAAAIANWKRSSLPAEKLAHRRVSINPGAAEFGERISHRPKGADS